MTRYSDLHKVFNPATVAIVGVSSYDKGNLDYTGLKFLRNFKSAGFKGRIYPINPRITGDIEGIKVYPSLSSVPEFLDLVIITVKAELVPDILEECVTVKARDVHICTSGFGETGEAEGKKLEARLRDIARRGELRICGPNSLGYHVPSAGLVVYEWTPRIAGNVALVSQSGGCGQFFILQCASRGIGVNKVISFGNALTLGATDYLEYLGEDPQTGIICMYLEGVNDGRKFTEQVRRINRKKPVIIWKGGVTESGARAVSTHTGSLAGDIRVWDAFFKQTGAVRVNSLDEMADAVMTFSRLNPFSGRKAAVFGGGGGGANVARGDLCTAEGLEVPAFSVNTRRKLMEFIPLVNQSVINPMDTPSLVHDNKILRKTLELLVSDSVINLLIVVIALESLWVMEEKDNKSYVGLKNIIAEFTRENKKPLVVALMDQSPMGKTVHYATQLREAGITVYATLLDACRSLSRFSRYHEYLERY